MWYLLSVKLNFTSISVYKFFLFFLYLLILRSFFPLVLSKCSISLLPTVKHDGNNAQNNFEPTKITDHCKDFKFMHTYETITMNNTEKVTFHGYFFLTNTQ